MPRYRIVYQDADLAADRRELVVEAPDEGSAYDRAMEDMRPDEALIEVVASAA